MQSPHVLFVLGYLSWYFTWRVRSLLNTPFFPIVPGKLVHLFQVTLSSYAKLTPDTLRFLPGPVGITARCRRPGVVKAGSRGRSCHLL